MEAVGTRDYAFELLTGVVDGAPRSIILFGEYHQKSIAASDAGKAVIKHFRAIATEGAQFEKLWGGKLLARLFDSEEAKVIDRGDALSTIRDALKAGQAQQLDRDVAEMFIENGNSNAEVSAFGDLDTSEGARVTENDIIEVMRTLNFAPGSNQAIVQTYHLEEGHLVGLVERMWPMALLIEIYGPRIATIGSLFYLVYAATLSADQLLPANTLLGLGLISVIASRNTKSRWLTWIQVKPRDATMTKNILKIFSGHPEVKRLLVIIGRNHIVGISALLKKHGFVTLAQWL